MKRVTVVAMTVCVMWLLPDCLQARVTLEYLRWTMGVFEAPPEIKKVTTISDLQPFLSNKREFTRMAAIRRLGEIAGQQAIALLLDVFNKEKPTRGIDAAPLVKLEAVRTLGRIGTNQSKSTLLDLLKQYWQQGPKVTDKSNYVLDRDFAFLMHALLRELDRWRDDTAVFTTVESIALSQEMKELYNDANQFGRTAWKVYLRGKMTKEGVRQEEDSVVYLLEFMENMAEPLRSDTLEYLKRLAARAVLAEHSKTCLSSLADRFETELKEQELLDPEGLLWRRHAMLRLRISRIRAALREKARRERVSRMQVSSATK